MEDESMAMPARVALWGSTAEPCEAHSVRGCSQTACVQARGQPRCVELKPRARVPAQAMSVAHVSCGWEHTLCVTTGGDVYAWGGNSYGQLGCGTERDRATPRRVRFRLQTASPLPPDAPPSVVAATERADAVAAAVSNPKDLTRMCTVVAGSHYSCAISAETREVWSWGRYQCANRPTQVARTWVGGYPHSSPLLGRRVAHLSCGETHIACVTEPDEEDETPAELYCWGYNEHGQLGLGDSRSVRHGGQLKVQKASLPIGVTPSVVACGGRHTVVVTTRGSVWSFGDGSHGQLGTSRGRGTGVPRRVSALRGRRCVSAACGRNFTVVLDARGSVFSFGSGVNGALGIGASGGSVSLPTRVPVPGTGARFRRRGDVEMDRSPSPDGAAARAGASDDDSPVPREPSPTPSSSGSEGDGDVAPGGAAVDMAVSSSDSDSDAETVTEPVSAGGVPLTGVVALACGDQHCLAMTRDGVFGWGYNSHGSVEQTEGSSSFVPSPIELRRWAGAIPVAVSACGGMSAVVWRPKPLSMQAAQVLQRHIDVDAVVPLMLHANMLQGTGSGDRLWEACARFVDNHPFAVAEQARLNGARAHAVAFGYVRVTEEDEEAESAGPSASR